MHVRLCLGRASGGRGRCWSSRALGKAGLCPGGRQVPNGNPRLNGGPLRPRGRPAGGSEAGHFSRPGGTRLTQIRVFQNAVRHVGRGAVQDPAFLAEKDLAARTAPGARRSPPRLQHARLLRQTPLPAGGDRNAQCPAPCPAPGSGARPHLSAGATKPPSSPKGLSQPQKPPSARRSSATCWVLDSWRSGL